MLMCWVSFQQDTAGHQLKPHEQHWFQSDKTPACSPVPHWPGPCLMGFHWQHNEVPQLEARGEVSWTLLSKYIDFCWRWVMAGCPLPVTDLADNGTPHFYIHRHKSLLFRGALNIIWDQLFDRNCTSLCTWHFFSLIKLQWKILYSLHIAWQMVILHCLSIFKSLENCKFYITIRSLS